MVIAIIPARGGSKRIPSKNVKSFLGKPLIAYSIIAAKESEIFDRIVVSTDSEKIRQIALAAGAEVPFLRPPELSGDFVTTPPVLKHALKFFEDKGDKINYFCNIFCNPFITPANLTASYELLKLKQCTGVIPTTTFPFPIYRSLRIINNGTVAYTFPEYASARSQDLEEMYHDVGQFYWWDYDKFLRLGSNMMQDRVPYILPEHLSRDLDTLEDWRIAEMQYTAFLKNESQRKLECN